MLGGADGGGFSFSLKGALTDGEAKMISGATALLFVMVIYAVVTTLLYNQMDDKIIEVAAEEARVETQESAMTSDKTKLDEKAAEYTELVNNLQDRLNINSTTKKLRYSIPTLLNKIMSSMPNDVQLKAITQSTENVGDEQKQKITITARSERMEAIGMFIAKLSNDAILNNVVSDTATTETVSWSQEAYDEKGAKTSKIITKDLVVVTIEGEIP